jgi:hypothetical protein
VGRVAFKKGSTSWVVAMPSHFPHASRPSTFRAPGWGAPALSSSRCGRSATLWRLVPFSHRSASRIFVRQPGCIPSPMVTQDGDHPFDGGDVGEGLVAAASALRSSLLLFGRPERRSLSLLQEWVAVSRLEFVVPRASWYGGCSYPRERNRSPVCNGILSAGVCSLRLSGPEHLCIWA